MIDISRQYQQLLHDKTQIAILRSCVTVADFFTALKQLWSLDSSDAELWQALQKNNLQLQEINLHEFAGNWFACGYRQQAVQWCAPDGPATEAFQDQYISRCQQLPLNQFIRPRTALPSLLNVNFAVGESSPAGFIFHLSRCGSTLVSGCLSQIASANVMSEPPAITELLLDHSLDSHTQMSTTKQLLQAQRLALPEHPQLILKWNAWDLLRWREIRATWPEVPIVLLVREPLEILASHERQAGRHMAGDRVLAELHPVFSLRHQCTANARFDVLAGRVAVLRLLLEQMHKLLREPAVKLVDYRQLDFCKIGEIAEFFKLPRSPESEVCVRARMQFHSKEPGREFTADSAQKRELFAQDMREYITRELCEPYRHLSAETTVEFLQ